MDLKHVIESVLFMHGEPVSVERLSRITKKDKGAILSALRELANEYSSRGICLIEKGNEWQFATNPENRAWLEDFIKSEFAEDLTRAALETLAIVAYKGPMTRAEVEYIRGVNSAFTIRNLLLRGLVERRENPKDARSFVYEASFDFLKYFGLQKIGELPQFEELRKKEIGLPAEDASEAA